MILSEAATREYLATQTETYADVRHLTVQPMAADTLETIDSDELADAAYSVTVTAPPELPGRRMLGHVGNSVLATLFPFAVLTLTLLLLMTGCESAGPTKRDEIATNWDHQRAALKYELANAELKQGHAEKAKPLAQEAVALNPEEPANHALLAKTFIAAGDFRAAEQILVTLLVEHPDEAEPLYLLGTIHEREEEWDLATDEYRRACAADADNLEYVIAFAQVQALAGNAAAAQQALTASAGSFRSEPKFHLARAELYREASDLPAAIQSYKDALRLGYDDAAARASLGLCLHWQGQHADALDYLNAAIDSQDSPSSAVLCAYAGCLLQLGRADEAVGWFAKNKKLPENAATYELLHAQALAETTDYTAALKAVRKAQEHDPGCAEAYLLEGGILARKDRQDDALAAVEKSLRLQPNNVQAWQYYAEMLEKFGEDSSAQQARGMIARLQRGEAIPTRGSTMMTSGT